MQGERKYLGVFDLVSSVGLGAQSLSTLLSFASFRSPVGSVEQMMTLLKSVVTSVTCARSPSQRQRSKYHRGMVLLPCPPRYCSTALGRWRHAAKRPVAEISSSGHRPGNGSRRDLGFWRLLVLQCVAQGEDIPLRVLEPGGEGWTQLGDAVDGFQSGKVVVLKDHAPRPKGGNLRADVLAVEP